MACNKSVLYGIWVMTPLRIMLATVMVAISFVLSSCAGPEAPTPPALIGEAPPSVMETVPPVDDQYAQTSADNAALSQPDTQPAPQTTSVPQTTPNNINAYQPPASNSILTFEPMVGAPKTVARELSKTLGLRIAEKALPVVQRTDTSVTHRIKGYFSARQSDQNCIVTYVWDIFDKNGKRVSRITGSQTAAMISSDPWDAVRGDVLDAVATDTAAKLKSWHTAHS